MGFKEWIDKNLNFGSDDEPENIPTPEEVIKKWADEPPRKEA